MAADAPPDVAVAQAAAARRRMFTIVDEEPEEREFDARQFLRILRYIGRYRRPAGVAVALLLLGSLASLAGPYLIKVAIDADIANRRLAGLAGLAAVYIAVQVVQWVASYWQSLIMARVGQGVLFDMRQQLFDHIQGLSFDFFDSRPAGKIMVRLTNDVDTLNQLLTGGVIQTISDSVTLVGIVLIMLWMSVPLALASFATIPLLVILATVLRGRIRQGWRRVRRKIANINAHLQESLSGMRVTQAFVQESNNAAFFSELNQDNWNTWMDTIRINALFGPAVELTSALGTALLFVVGVHYLVLGAVTIGTLVAFLSYLGRFWGPISNLSNFYNQLLQAMASAERVFGYMDTPPQVADAPGARELPPVAGRVTFDHVTFAYQADRPVLHDVCFDVQPGEMVALVGHTGAGKTSVVSLINRFYDPTGGAVLVDGYDLRTVTLQSLRRQVALVLQDTFLFTGTIADNIRYGRLDASDDEVVAAARAVHAHEFISRLAQGYATEVRERGSRLSVGQRQLLSFARALLADPRILILDEATSSIDTQTELLIQDALRTLLAGRTSFVIAHRLSTIRNADRIFVMEDGRIVEAGDHRSLLARRGRYYQLLRAQYRVDEAS